MPSSRLPVRVVWFSRYFRPRAARCCCLTDLRPNKAASALYSVRCDSFLSPVAIMQAATIQTRREGACVAPCCFVAQPPVKRRY
jgi:hypothetical protein